MCDCGGNGDGRIVCFRMRAIAIRGMAQRLGEESVVTKEDIIVIRCKRAVDGNR